MKKIDFDRIVFVVDTPIIALMVAILARGQKINCIYEKKYNFFENDYYELFDLILDDVYFLTKEKYVVPQPFFILDKKHPFKTISKLVDFRAQTKNIKLDPSKIYAGSFTSSIMAMIYPETRKIYMDHGTGDYYKRMIEGTSNALNTRQKVRYNFFRTLDFPNLSYTIKRRVYTC